MIKATSPGGHEFTDGRSRNDCDGDENIGVEAFGEEGFDRFVDNGEAGEDRRDDDEWCPKRGEVKDRPNE